MNGVPVSINGKSLKLVEIVKTLNKLGAKHGVGVIDYVESYIFGHKGREFYVAPAAKILITAHQDLENYLLEKLTLKQKKSWDQEWSYMVYHGLWFHPLQNILKTVIKEANKDLDGEITVKIFKGNLTVVGRTSKNATKFFFSEKIVDQGFHEEYSAGLIELFGLEMRLKG